MLRIYGIVLGELEVRAFVHMLQLKLIQTLLLHIAVVIAWDEVLAISAILPHFTGSIPREVISCWNS